MYRTYQSILQRICQLFLSMLTATYINNKIQNKRNEEYSTEHYTILTITVTIKQAIALIKDDLVPTSGYLRLVKT